MIPPFPPSPPLLSLPSNDSQDAMPVSQPMCTPVDQVIVRTDHPSIHPPSPMRTAVKRRRINPRKPHPSSSSNHAQCAAHSANDGKISRPFTGRLVIGTAISPCDLILQGQGSASQVPPDLVRSDSMDTNSLDMQACASFQQVGTIGSLGDDDSIPMNSQPYSQRDLPQFSQDTLALLPNLVREHQLACSTRPRSTPAPQMASDVPPLGPGCGTGRPPSASSDGLLRASLVSALASAAPMLNPYLPEVKAQPTGVSRPPNASDSFQNLDMAFCSQDGFNLGGRQTMDVGMPQISLPKPAVQSVAPDRSSTHPRFGSQASSHSKKSLKLLLVASAQRHSKSADFDMRNLAGRGAFSEVWRAIHRIDGCEYAIKKNRVALVSDHARLQSLHEVFALAALQGHPNILRYFDAWFEEHGKFLFVQTEYLPSGNLHARYVDRGEAMCAEDLISLAHDLAAGLEFMHVRNVAHVDVKPDNIFSTNRGRGRPSYIIGDFGLACNRYGHGARNTEGDSRYLCPEALSSDDDIAAVGSGAMIDEAQEDKIGYNDEKKPRSKIIRPMDALRSGRDLCTGDVFSLGATLYELALGVPLEKSGPQWKRLRTFPSDAAREVEQKSGCDFLANVVRRCLEPDPHQRLSAAEVRHMCESHADLKLSSERDQLRAQLAEAQARIARFENVMSTLLAKGEKGRQQYRSRRSQKLGSCRSERIVHN